ncbi:site-2 protease family protein [archaeon]|nr:site-2 protease family protein [archaeon]
MKSIEAKHLVVSWLTISLAFAWAVGGFAFSTIWFYLPVMLLAVGTGFILHELAHKYVAMHFGAHAEYRMWVNGLILALFMALLLGVVFAAPGAVYIYGPHITRKQNGLISIAGILTNIFIGSIFLLLGLAGFIPGISFLVMQVNYFLALFNLIPIMPLDGSKVFAWNKGIWAAAFIPLLLVFVFIFPMF